MFACSWDADEQERLGLASAEPPLSHHENHDVPALPQCSFSGRHSHHWHHIGLEPSFWRVLKAVLFLPTNVSGDREKGQGGSENVLLALTIRPCALA